jgi:hypothetical protein
MTSEETKVTQSDFELYKFRNPECFDFTAVDDIETQVGLKTGFVLQLPELRIGSSWRFIPDGSDLVLESLVGSTWIEQSRFTP